MTAVTFSPRGIGDQSDTEPIFSGGFYKIRLAATQTSGQWVLPAWSTPRQLTGSLVTENLDANPTIPYELLMYVPNGGSTVGKLGGMLEIHEFRIVAGAGPVAWEALVLVTGPTGDAVPTGTQAAINADLYAQLAATSGGASTLAAITNMSPLARLLNTDTTTGAMQSRLQVQPTASPVFTTALTAANPTFTGTVTIPDNALAIADTSGLQTALDAKAPLASPALTGTPTVPTATAGTNTTQVASTQFVTTAVAGVTGGGGAPLASPAFTGTPTAPTATAGTNTTQLATTGFVTAAVALVPSQTAIDDLNTLVTSLTARVQALEANGANLAAIAGNASPRNNPLTGGVLNPGTDVVWLVDGTAPTNAVTGDIILNRVTV
jgi:hypothetical protein